MMTTMPTTSTTNQTTFTFDSRIARGPFLPDFAQEQVKNEPMLFSCDWRVAQDLGGPLTQAFLARLGESWENEGVIIDSRVHMLMPGWFPCIPGWHHDDVPRERSDGQPNYHNPSYRSEHVMALVGGGSSVPVETPHECQPTSFDDKCRCTSKHQWTVGEVLCLA